MIPPAKVPAKTFTTMLLFLSVSSTALQMQRFVRKEGSEKEGGRDRVRRNKTLINKL